MKGNEEAFLAQFARRNWLFFGLLILLSLALGSPRFTYGVIAGGAIVVTGYCWLHWSLVKSFNLPGEKDARRIKLSFYIRLATLGAVLYVLLTIVKVDPFGLILGLSVVVINLLWTTLRRAF